MWKINKSTQKFKKIYLAFYRNEMHVQDLINKADEWVWHGIVICTISSMALSFWHQFRIETFDRHTSNMTVMRTDS